MSVVSRTKVNKLKSLIQVTTGASVFFAGWCIFKGNEKFYNEVAMPLLRCLPAELSHNLAVLACKYKVFPAPRTPDPDSLATQFFAHRITNPIGIAAGFDKHGEAVAGLAKLGFGLVEVGSVTPEPQTGNAQPRVFRLHDDEALINRYGFNSDGHKAVHARLAALRDGNAFAGAVLGVNLGKNRTSSSALEDYVRGVQVFGPIADYLVVNVSSPNTAGLRALQGKRELEQLLAAVMAARNALPSNTQVPVLLKISPDLSQQDAKDIAAVIATKACRVDGLIVANTTVTRDNLRSPPALTSEAGGLSGAPLCAKSTQLIAEMFHHTGGKIPIIGVGGIRSGRDAFEKLEAGASYLQIYTALVYQGPQAVARIKAELAELLAARGYRNVTDAVGKNHKQYLRK